MITNEAVAVLTQTTYQNNNSTIFYSLVNSAFLPYYNTVVRKSTEWLDGRDYAFHKEDMVSSRIASRLMYGFTKSIFGRGMIFKKGRGNTEQTNETLDFISHKWCDEADFQNVVKRLISFTLPIGTGAIKTNRTSDGKVWLEPFRMDYFYYTVDGRKKPQSFTSFIRCFTSIDKQDENYFMVEKRFFKVEFGKFTEEINGKKMVYEKKNELHYIPYVTYKIYKYTGTVNNNTMPSACSGSSISYKTLPAYVKKALREEYGFIILDEEQKLPFAENDLGVDLFFNEGGDMTNPTLPVGRSYCFDCLADFIEYDMDKSYAIRDLYNSKGIVGVPKSLSQGELSKPVPGTGDTLHKISAFSQLNIPGYEYVNGLDPNSQKPIINQFEMRAQEHEIKQNAILKSIATTIGISPKAIASFLTTTTQATDDQIQSEDDSVVQWIKSHRQDYVVGLNRIIERVLNLYGKPENIEVSFASDGLLKGDKQLENIKTRLDMNLLTLEGAIREYYSDEDEVQLLDRIAKAKEQQAINEQNQMTEFDEIYGDTLNGEENELNEEQLPKQVPTVDTERNNGDKEVDS